MEYHDHKFNPIHWSKIKGYLWPRICLEDETRQISSPTERTCTNRFSEETMKEFKIYRAGDIKIQFSFKLDNYCQLKLYHNSTQLAAYMAYSEGDYSPSTWYSRTVSSPISWGDTITIKMKNAEADQYSYVKDVYLCWQSQIIKYNTEVILN